MATDICAQIGRNVRALRKARKWTQTYLSVHAGVGRNYISDVELDRKEIGVRNLQLLAHSFGVKTSRLLKDVD